MDVRWAVMVFLFAFTTVASVVVAAYAWHTRRTDNDRWLVLLLLMASVWPAGALLTYVTPRILWLKTVSVNVQLSASLFVPLFWLLFILGFTGDSERVQTRHQFLLAIPAAVLVPLIWTTSVHGLVYRNLQFASDLNGITVVWGPASLWLVSFGYLFMILGTILLIRFILTTRNLYQWQAMALLVIGVVPFLMNVVCVFGPLPIDLAPVGFSASAVLFFLATSRTQFMDVVPVARDTVVTIMEEGVVVIDGDHRFLDVNPRAAEILGVDAESVIGRTVTEGLPQEAWQRAFFDALEAGDADVTIQDPTDRGTYRMQVSPLREARGGLLGHVVVIHDVTEQKQRERELQRQNDRLEEFASVVSHDLRNPLNVAAMNLELVEADEEPVANAKDAVARMDTIVEDVLQLAREGQIVEETSQISIRDCAQRAWAAVATGDADLTIEDDVTVDGDPERLARAFENLFRNAVEHSATSSRSETSEDASEYGNTEVTVTVGPLDDGPAGFFVADDGPGIPPSERETVFEHGYSNAADGTGFGLSIVQSIVEAHGWTIAVTDSESGGARFDIRTAAGT